MHGSLCHEMRMFPSRLSLACNDSRKISLEKPLNHIFKAMTKLVIWSPSNWALWEGAVCRHWETKLTSFLGCWFFLSNRLTSPIHNRFTGYFFKICIGRVLKTTNGLLIMDNVPRCSVRCLPNSWQQCLGIMGLSFLCFFPANLRGKAEGLGDRSGVKLWSVGWHAFSNNRDCWTNGGKCHFESAVVTKPFLYQLFYSVSFIIYLTSYSC